MRSMVCVKPLLPKSVKPLQPKSLFLHRKEKKPAQHETRDKEDTQFLLKHFLMLCMLIK